MRVVLLRVLLANLPLFFVSRGPKLDPGQKESSFILSCLAIRLTHTPPQTPAPSEKALKIQSGGVEKKKKKRPPEPVYISQVKNSLAQVNEALAEMREEKKKRRAEKEAARKKVTFQEKDPTPEPEDEEPPVTQHQPEEPLAMEEDEEDDLRTDEVMPTEEELALRANPFARKLSRRI